jgi:hypothetical protein
MLENAEQCRTVENNSKSQDSAGKCKTIQDNADNARKCDTVQKLWMEPSQDFDYLQLSI